MTKRSIFLLVIIVNALLISAQTQQGVVKTKGRLVNGQHIKGTPLGGATVTVKGRNAVVSSNNGKFSLAIPGNNYYLQNVQKQGYVLTDPDVLSKQYVQSNNPLILVMETPDEQTEDKLEAMEKIQATLQTRLIRSRAKIRSLKEQNKLTQEEYRQKLQELADIQENNQQLVSEMAERYSKIDYDLLDEFNRRISAYILNGELQKADSLLKTKGDINTRTADLRQLQEQNAKEEAELTKRKKKLEKRIELAQKEMEDIAKDCYSKFEIFKMQHMNDSAVFYIEKRACLDSTNVDWMIDAGSFLAQYLADYEKGLIYFQSALVQALKSKPTHPSLGTCYLNIGYVYKKRDAYEEALKYYMLSLETEKERRGENNPEVAICYDNIAQVYADYEQFEQSDAYYQKALDILLSHYGEKSPKLIVAYSGIGMNLFQREQYDEALHYLTMILEIVTKEYGEMSNDAATAYNNLSNVYKRKGDMEKSIEYAEKSLTICKAVFGENHPDVAISYNNLGFIFWRLKEYDKAEGYLKKALDIKINIFGDQSSQVGTAYNNLAGLYDTQGQYEKALEYAKKGLEIREEVFKDTHPDVSASYNNIGGIYRELTRYDEAFLCYNKALELRKKLFGNSHPAVASVYENMASLHNKLQQIDKALECLNEAYNIYKTKYPEDNQHIIKIKEKIASTEKKRNCDGKTD